MKDKISLVLNIIQTIALIIIVVLLLNTEKKEEPKQMTSQLEAKVKNTEPIVLTENDAIWGSNDAPNTLVAYIDYECPYCKSLYMNIKDIEKDYIKTGKVKVILRDLPLNMHRNAKTLAAATECARAKGKFWELTDLILTSKDKFTDDQLPVWAGQAGLDTTELKSCMEDLKTLDIIKIDMDDARARHITGTPAVFINNEYFKGAISTSDLKLILDGKRPEKKSGSGACGK